MLTRSMNWGFRFWPTIVSRFRDREWHENFRGEFFLCAEEWPISSNKSPLLENNFIHSHFNFLSQIQSLAFRILSYFSLLCVDQVNINSACLRVSNPFQLQMEQVDLLHFLAVLLLKSRIRYRGRRFVLVVFRRVNCVGSL